MYPEIKSTSTGENASALENRFGWNLSVSFSTPSKRQVKNNRDHEESDADDWEDCDPLSPIELYIIIWDYVKGKAEEFFDRSI